ncbi:hypothetical protein [Aliigemmobacter aestuarii]|uniref:hypothetical protein n=1 Tax=Aliigemmobacter aestuarii TaxID=1445661 RepID=UPI0026A4C5D6
MSKWSIALVEDHKLIREGARIFDVGGWGVAGAVTSGAFLSLCTLPVILDHYTALELNDMSRQWDLLNLRSFGYGHSFGGLSHDFGREAGVELREAIDTQLKPAMVVSRADGHAARTEAC